MKVSKEPTTPNHNPVDTVEVDNIDHFVAILTDWHSGKVKTLQHMAEIPPGSEMETEGGITVVMHGEFLDGFKAGIGLALMELGTLPFAAEPEAVAPTDEPVPQ